ncbi:MAG: hypothetical protein Q8942_09285 [Bacillota bacterium]|nr:hypothetical protein [Bacillota bacterium]
MKQFNNVEELKQAFNDTRLPSVDFSDSVMYRIDGISPQKHISGKKKILITVLASILVLVTVGFSSVYIFDLNGPGNNNYKYKVFDSSDSFPPDLYENEYKLLEPGKALAIAKVKEGSNHSVQVREKPVIIKSIDELSQKVGVMFKKPLELPDGYKFKEGSIGYKLEDIDFKALMGKGKKSGEDYAYQVLNHTNDISNYSITYQKGETTIFVSAVFNYQSDEIAISKSGHLGFKADKIRIKDYDAMYLEHNGSAEIQWLDKAQSKSIYYSIRSTMLKKDTKDNLLKITESIQ